MGFCLQKERNGKQMQKYFHGKHTCRCAPNCPVCYDLVRGECEKYDLFEKRQQQGIK